MLTTPPPRLDAVAAFPELAPLARTTVRLHPRRAADGPVDASKMGGTFLWPRGEPWPAGDEKRVARIVQELLANDPLPGDRPIPPGTAIPYAPILQLRADDFPEMPFPPGADLFQLLWFPFMSLPESGPSPPSILRHRAYWRRAADVREPRARNPAMVERRLAEAPHPCRLHPERVVEYPHSQDLDPKLERRIDRWKAAARVDNDGDSPIDLYDWELSACPSTKVGGYPFYVQDKRPPFVCACGRTMDHLLTVALHEWDGGTEERWCPVEERGREVEPAFEHGDLYFYLSVCTHCPGFPTRARTER